MPLVIVANPKLPVASIAELVDYAKKNPGKLNYASPGNGTIGHLAGELFKHMTGTDIVHVPYRGSAPALQDLLAGSVELSVDNLPPYRSYILNGQLRALGITTEQRWPAIGTVPTVQEAGVAGYRASSWFSLVGPAKLPHAIVATLNRTLNDWLRSEDGSKRLLDLGYRPVGGTPEDHERFVRADVERWGPIIQKAGVKLD
jgi:tripartite-type tricarboxylate transporter receptor subunit TctC